MQRYIVPVQGNSFSFLTSIVEALKEDHGIFITVPQTQQLILDYLLHNFEKYLPFYSAQLNPWQPRVHLSDALLSELVQFFDDGQFNCNVINILVKKAADALNLNCFILQSNQGQIEVLNYKSGNFWKKIFFKFTHNNIHLNVNHYVPLIKNKKIQKVIPWPQGFMKFHTNTDEQDLPLDPSKKSENSSSQEFASQEFENTIEDVHYVYSEVTNEEEEIIYVQNMNENENEGTDEPTAPGEVNTPDYPIQHEEFDPGNEENDQMEQNGLSEKKKYKMP